jgi:hypothetical protein
MNGAQYAITKIRRVPMVAYEATELVTARDAAEAVWKYLEDQREKGIDVRGQCLLVKLGEPV